MKRAKLIEESISSYLSPVVCFPNPDGALRVCIDFCIVNQDIFKDSYPMHCIEEQLEAMGGLRVITEQNLTKWYYRFVLHPEFKPITAFLTPEGLYQ